VPNLTKEDTAFGVNSIDDGFPCFHLLLRPYARRVGIPSEMKSGYEDEDEDEDDKNESNSDDK